MDASDYVRFYRLVLESDTLQERLRGAESEDDLYRCALEIGAEHGLELTEDGLRARARPVGPPADDALDDAALDAVSGGAAPQGDLRHLPSGDVERLRQITRGAY